MPISEKSLDSEQELRWREWQEKGRRTDKLAQKRTKALFSIVGLVLLAVLLYHVFRSKITPDSDHVEHAVVSDHIPIFQRMGVSREDLESCSAMPDTIAA